MTDAEARALLINRAKDEIAIALGAVDTGLFFLRLYGKIGITEDCKALDRGTQLGGDTVAKLGELSDLLCYLDARDREDHDYE